MGGAKRGGGGSLGTGGGGGPAPRTSSSILEQAKAAAERAKKAKVDAAREMRATVAPLASAAEPPGAGAGAKPAEPPAPRAGASRWDDDSDDPDASAPPAARSRWGGDASDDASDDDEPDANARDASGNPSASRPTDPPANESYMDKMVREAMEFKLAAAARDASFDRGAAEDLETRARPVDVAKIVAAVRTPSSDGDATPREEEPGKIPGGTSTSPSPHRPPLDEGLAADLDDLDDPTGPTGARRSASPERADLADDVSGTSSEEPPPPRDASPRRRASSASPSPSPARDVARVFDATAGCRGVHEFEQLNRIDEGTYGVVFRARDKRTGEVKALKKVKMEKEREGFPLTALREANILIAMRHPNVVDVAEMVVGASLDSVFMVMEFCEHDLKALMETMPKPFTIPEVKCLMRQLASGVSYLHENWVLHRDLKTSNVLVNNRGELKLCDFGLARRFGDPARAYTQVVVTLWYRAPELLLGERVYGTAIDAWSLGCIFAELLAKEPLFQGKNEADQTEKIFALLGAPDERVWPGHATLPNARKAARFKHQPHNRLRSAFPERSANDAGPTISDAGFDLLNRLLAYDPARRASARDALDHAWFEEFPPAKDRRLMPTFPSKAAGGLGGGGRDAAKRLAKTSAAGRGARGGGRERRALRPVLRDETRSSNSRTTRDEKHSCVYLTSVDIISRKKSLAPSRRDAATARRSTHSARVRRDARVSPCRSSLAIVVEKIFRHLPSHVELAPGRAEHVRHGASLLDASAQRLHARAALRAPGEVHDRRALDPEEAARHGRSFVDRERDGAALVARRAEVEVHVPEGKPRARVPRDVRRGGLLAPDERGEDELHGLRRRVLAAHGLRNVRLDRVVPREDRRGDAAAAAGQAVRLQSVGGRRGGGVRVTRARRRVRRARTDEAPRGRGEEGKRAAGAGASARTKPRGRDENARRRHGGTGP